MILHAIQEMVTKKGAVSIVGGNARKGRCMCEKTKTVISRSPPAAGLDFGWNERNRDDREI